MRASALLVDETNRLQIMECLFALLVCASVRLATGMTPLMGSFVPVGRPQSEEAVRMMVQQSAAANKFPITPTDAPENMHAKGQRFVGPVTRMPKMLKYRDG